MLYRQLDSWRKWWQCFTVGHAHRANVVPIICDHWRMQQTNTPPTAEILVACLCANWCGTCREYQPLFEQLQAQLPNIRFLWIDVEDESDLVDPIEVENFPTLLIAKPGTVHCFGTVTPHRETLLRLIEAQRATDARALPASPDRDDLVKRLWQHNVPDK